MGFFSKVKEQATANAVENAKRVLGNESEKLSRDIDAKTMRVNDLASQVKAKEEELSSLLAQIEGVNEMVEYGVTAPKFDFTNIDEYKIELTKCRDEQKKILRGLTEKANQTTWVVNDSKAKGKKMVKDITKLIMRAYNGECDDLVRKVSAKNVDAYMEKADKSAQAISKLGTVIGLEVPQSYIALKKKEILLAYEYALKKEEEKERVRELRAQEREAAKAAKEMEAEKKKLEKEKRHHDQALADIVKRLASASDDERSELMAKKDELEAAIADVDRAIEDVDYRAANQRAGYVYVISNIGSFGEGVYKIGMTRRLEPMDRVRELGDASVPFNFDVHALIFTEDAPGLETALHHAFEDRRVNKVNSRREFFRVSLDEVKHCVHENFDGTAEFFDIPDAAQYRETLAMDAALEN